VSKRKARTGVGLELPGRPAGVNTTRWTEVRRGRVPESASSALEEKRVKRTD